MSVRTVVAAAALVAALSACGAEAREAEPGTLCAAAAMPVETAADLAALVAYVEPRLKAAAGKPVSRRAGEIFMTAARLESAAKRSGFISELPAGLSHLSASLAPQESPEEMQAELARLCGVRR